jgi:hypothetical protein
LGADFTETQGCIFEFLLLDYFRFNHINFEEIFAFVELLDLLDCTDFGDLKVADLE